MGYLAKTYKGRKGEVLYPKVSKGNAMEIFKYEEIFDKSNDCFKDFSPLNQVNWVENQYKKFADWLEAKYTKNGTTYLCANHITVCDIGVYVALMGIATAPFVTISEAMDQVDKPNLDKWMELM